MCGFKLFVKFVFWTTNFAVGVLIGAGTAGGILYLWERYQQIGVILLGG